MMALFYSILSSIFIIWFSLTIVASVVFFQHHKFYLLHYIMQQPVLEPSTKSVKLIQEPPLPITTPGDIPVSIDTKENYVLEPQGDGFYKLLNTPIEPMSTREELNKAVNEFRKAQGKHVLELDPQLCNFADLRAREVNEEFSHNKFSQHIDEGMADQWGFLHFGENIWQGAMMGVHIVEYGWARSPGHYAALVGDWTKGCSGVFNENAVFIFAR